MLTHLLSACCFISRWGIIITTTTTTTTTIIVIIIIIIIIIYKTRARHFFSYGA